MIIRNAYRGVHRAGTWIDGRGLAISFSTGSVATQYATHPNHKGDIVENPRVYCCDLTITKPLFNNPKDSFISARQLIDAVGPGKALQIYQEMEEVVKSTDTWARIQEQFKFDYKIMFEFRKFERHLFGLDIPLWPLLANDEYVSWFKEAGYDGAVFQGSGVGNDAPEYVIFDRAQARQIHLAYIG